MPKLSKFIKEVISDKIIETADHSPTISETLGEMADHIKRHYNPIKKLQKLKHDHDAKVRREREKARDIHEEGYINRKSFKAGDIFINYTKDSFGEDREGHVVHNMTDKLLNKVQNVIKNRKIKIPVATVQSPTFGHGGIIISDTHYMHTGITGQGPLTIDPISRNFTSRKKYHVFRPKRPSLAEKIVDVALDLYWNNYIPFTNEAIPQQPLHLAEFLRQARMCENNRALLKSSSITAKGFTDIRAEYEAMLEQAPDLQDEINQRKNELNLKFIFETHSRSNIEPWTKQTFVDKNIEHYLSTLTPTGVNVKQFLSTQFIALVIQAVNRVSDKRDLVKLSERELVELIRQNNFTEYKSEETGYTGTESDIENDKAIFALPIAGIAATKEEVETAKLQRHQVLNVAKQAAVQAEAGATRAEAEVTRVRAEVAKTKAQVANAQEQVSILTIKIMKETPTSLPGRIKSNAKNWVSKKVIGGSTKASQLESARVVAERNHAIAVEAETRMSAIEQIVAEEAIKARVTAIIAKNEELEINKRHPYISTNTLLYEALTPPKYPKVLTPAALLVSKKPAPLPPAGVQAFKPQNPFGKEQAPLPPTGVQPFKPQNPFGKEQAPLPPTGVQPFKPQNPFGKEQAPLPPTGVRPFKPQNPFGKEQAPLPPVGKPPIYPTGLNPFEKKQAPPPPQPTRRKK